MIRQRRGVADPRLEALASRLPLGLLALSLLLPLLLLPTAAAHADLLQAAPGANSAVDQAPGHLELSFSEPLEDAYTRVQVLDGDDVDHAQATEIHEDDRRKVTVPLDPLADGTYTIRWRTLSAADGHTRSGVYFLAVNVSLSGSPGEPAPANQTTELSGQGAEVVPTLEPIFRGLAFMGASLAVGLPLFLLMARASRLPGELADRLTQIAAGSAGVATLAGLGIASQMAVRIDGNLGQALGTSNGQVLVLRLGLLAATGVLLLAATLPRLADHRATLMASGVSLGLASLLATTLGGHAAAETTHLARAVIVDWLHQAAIAFWFSGVVALTLVASARVPEALGADLVRRFSPLAVASVIVIVVTGTIASIDRLPTWKALWSTGYGQALLAKISLMVPLVLLGAYHRYLLLPDLETPGHKRRDMGRLRTSAGAEAVLMVVVLVVAGVLTSLAPPTPAAAGQPAASTDEPAFEPYHTFNGSGLDVRVFIKPQPVQVGFQEIFLELEPQEGSEINVSEIDVFATFRPPSSGGEASPREAHILHNGTRHFGGAIFTEAGTWTADITIQGPVFLQETLEIEVQPAGGP